MSEPRPTAHYHLPGLFEFYDFYRVFLPLFRRHRSYPILRGLMYLTALT